MMSRQFDPEISLAELDSVFTNYKFISSLGGGGQAEVFKAKRLEDEKEVAVKLYSPTQLLKRAELEVEKLLQADSPYLAKVVEYGNFSFRNENCYYVMTEYSNGEDLKKIFLRGTLTEDQTTRLLKDMVSAIEELWKLKVVHCDIKPANILCLKNGSYKLIDLGFAKHLDADTITMAGTFFGTAGYMAPEQLKGRKNLTLRADLFALGILLYEAITGVHPFNRDQMLIFNEIEPKPVEQLVKINDKLAKAINWMIELNSLKRPNSCQKILNILKEAE